MEIAAAGLRLLPIFGRTYHLRSGAPFWSATSPIANDGTTARAIIPVLIIADRQHLFVALSHGQPKRGPPKGPAGLVSGEHRGRWSLILEKVRVCRCRRLQGQTTSIPMDHR